jgi:hypothetical protein
MEFKNKYDSNQWLGFNLKSSENVFLTPKERFKAFINQIFLPRHLLLVFVPMHKS